MQNSNLRKFLSCGSISMRAWTCLPLALMSAITPALIGQTGDNADDEVYELSPFVVSESSRDIGYLSSNSTSGTSINMMIRDLPMPLEVLNREFITDIQASDFKEALDYSAGVFTQSFQSESTSVVGFGDNSPSAVGSVNDPFQNAVSIRGYSVPNQQRAGFRVGSIVPAYNVVLGGNTDTITTERIEIVRGPQALLYGINVLSGIVNIIPKRPMDKQDTTIGLSVGNFDYFRASVDTTGPVIPGKLNYRVMGAIHKKSDEIDFRKEQREIAGLQFDWKITKKASLLVEYMHSEQRLDGIGTQFVQDSDVVGALNSRFNWRNEYGELIRFGYDDITADYEDPEGGVWSNPFLPKPGEEYDLSTKGRNFNISGPDTFRERKEDNLMALLTLMPTDSLSIELGAYYSKVEEEEFNVDIRGFNNRRGSINPGDSTSSAPALNWQLEPEIVAAGGQNAVAADPYGYVLGEAFHFPRVFISKTADGNAYVSYEDPDFTNPTYRERKFARYMWYKKPTSADTVQLRGRFVYDIDTDFFGERASHKFIGGYHFIRDEVNFVSGGVVGPENSPDRDHYSPGKTVLAVVPGKPPMQTVPNTGVHRDPVYFRQSVLDFEPMRYNNETLAIPGNHTTNNLGITDSHVMRSGWKEATLWFRGMYGIYSGQFWNDKLTVIAGVRRDAYQVKEKEQLLVRDVNRVTDQWFGNNETNSWVPGFIGYGDKPYVWRDDLPDSLNQNVQKSIADIMNAQPGTIEYNFDDYQTFTTTTAGLSYRITDDISIYFLHSEGVFPNSGQRDGLNNPISAEQTINNEIGFKFDLWDGKVSGTLSVYKIKRENAVYYWGAAPAPTRWHGGENGPGEDARDDHTVFSPQAALGPDSGYLGDRHYPRAYGVAESYVRAAAREAGQAEIDYNEHAQYGAVAAEERGVFNAPSGWTERFWIVPYETLQNDSSGNVDIMRRAFEMAMNRELILDESTGEMVEFQGTAMLYGGPDFELNNPSESAGSNILFEEEGIGIDGQLIFTPVRNYQIIFGFSHQKREVTGGGFNLVDPVDGDGNQWGTEYDAWVYALGPENFEDPTRPSTFTGGSVRGLDLSFVPQTSLRLWNKYTFPEDTFLSGLSVGAGVQYNSSVPTSVPIGGVDLIENRYRTPDIPARYVFDALVSYKFQTRRISWSINLNIDNVFNDQWAEPVVTYVKPNGVEIKRRSAIRYEPRFYRLSVTARF